MKKQSLVERLTAYLKKNPDVWFPKGELARLAENVGYLGETCGRRLRELSEDGTLESKENEKGHVMYKWHKQERIVSHFERVGDTVREIQTKLFA